MTLFTLITRLVGAGGQAALVLLAALALAACLPLQFGFERPTPLSTAATQIVQAPSDTPAPTPAGIGSATPTDDVTPLPSTTATPEEPTTAGGPPSSTPPATPTSAPPSATARPNPTFVECTLTHTVRPGERLSQIGELYGVRWQDIASLNGLTNPGLIFSGQVLCLPPNARLPNTPTLTATASATASATSTPTITATPSTTVDPCPSQGAPDWFFTPTPPVCATAAALTSQAAAQRFERGQMIWLGTLDQYFVLFDGGSASTRFMTYLPGPLDLKPGASPDNRVPETPPPGLEQPVSGFGLIWRGEVVGAESVRAALGWATQSEAAFTTTYQCQASTTVEWNCYLRAPGGQVLRLYFTPGIGFFWDTWPS